MKSIFRIGILAAIIVATTLTPALTTRAQGNFCPTGLSADDCKLISDAAAAMPTVKMFVVDYNLDLKTTGTPSDVTLSLKGNGAFDISKIKTADVATDPTSSIKNLVMQNTLSFDAVMAGKPEEKGTLELRLVDGVGYFNGGSTTQDKWYKLDLSQGMGAMGAMGGAVPKNPAQLTPSIDPGTLTALTTLFKGATSTATTDGPVVDGVKTKQMTLTLDAQALAKGLNTPEGATVLKALMAAMPKQDPASGQGSPAMNPDQMMGMLPGVLALLDPTLKATKISANWLIDPAAKQFRGFGINFSTTVDANTIATIASFSGGTPGSGQPITVDFKAGFTLSSLNAPVKVEAVADAVDFGAMIKAMMGSSMMGGSLTGTAQPTMQATTAQ